MFTMINKAKKLNRTALSKVAKIKKKRGVRVDHSGHVQISISMSPELIAAVEELATRQQRNRSNYIANQLKQLAEAEGLL